MPVESISRIAGKKKKKKKTVNIKSMGKEKILAVTMVWFLKVILH